MPASLEPTSRARAIRVPLEGLVASLLSLAFAAWVLQLWRADLAVPLRYAPVDDTKFYLMLVKGIAEHGWYLSNPHLGAPFGQQLSDYPQGADNLNLAIVRFLSLFSSNAALIVNLFFLLTFALVSFVAHLVLRSLGLSAIAAGVAAVLYALLAYHFFRGESHLLLSAYYAVPLSAYLLLGLLGDKDLFARRAGARRPRLAWASGRSLGTLAICVLIGSENLYYATFAAVMIALAAIVALLGRHRRSAFAGLAIVLLISASVTANLAPSLIYRAEHGSNTALERSAAFTEQSDEAFSLRLANLILPAPESRIAPLRQIAKKYDEAIAPGYCESCYASLGTVGTIGFLWLVLAALAALAGAGAAWWGTRRLVRHASLGAILAIAVGTVGGLASLIEVFVTPDIRAWNRISVFIAFLSLLAVGLLLDSCEARSVARVAERRSAGSRARRCCCSACTTRRALRPSRATPRPRASGAATRSSCTRSKRRYRVARASFSFPTFRSRRDTRKHRSATRSRPTRRSTSRCAATCIPRRCVGATARPRDARATGQRSSPASRSPT